MFILGVSPGAELIRIKAEYLRRPRNERAQSRVMIATINRKSSHPAATNKVLTIRRLPYHDTAAAFRRRRCWEACTFGLAIVFRPLSWPGVADRVKSSSWRCLIQ